MGAEGPMPSRYFEDFNAGDVWEFDPWRLDQDSIVEFAKRHDPQPMHTEPGSPATEPYGGIIASGWQTAMACVTPFLEAVMKDTAGLASPGFDVFRWKKPVRPGQPIRPTVRILSVRRSSSKPDRGLVQLRFAGVDEEGDDVWEAEGVFFIACRDVP